MEITDAYASPEMLRGVFLEQGLVVDCCAHDMWSLGYLIACYFGHQAAWHIESESAWQDLENLQKAHQDWVSLLGIFGLHAMSFCFQDIVALLHVDWS